jgi:GTP-binding protein Era
LKREQVPKFKAGYVAVIGRPNVGKSTLINGMLDFRLSITTAKPQTTRNRILGILNGEFYQLIFLDTPGLIQPNYRLQQMMVKAAERAIADADIVLFLTACSENIHARDVDIAHRLKSFAKPTVLVINKIDICQKSSLLPLIETWHRVHGFEEIVPISALKKENIQDLKKVILDLVPSGPAFYPTDMVTEHPERFFVSEIIREKILQNFSQEIPYSTAVVIDEFQEGKSSKDHIKARIIVERASQKKILIGKAGRSLRKIGCEARREIEDFLGRPVYLELWVTLKDKWRDKDAYLKEFGYKN